MPKSKRLFLKKLKPKDYTILYLKALNDNSIMKFTESRHQNWTKNKIINFISSHDKNNLLFGIFLKKINTHIGNIRLFNINYIHNTAELSFLLFGKNYFGKGYMTEAVNAITKYGFEKYKLNKIYADYYEYNIGSAKVFKKCKFVKEAVLKKQFKFKNKYISSIKVAKFKN